MKTTALAAAAIALAGFATAVSGVALVADNEEQEKTGRDQY